MSIITWSRCLQASVLAGLVGWTWTAWAQSATGTTVPTGVGVVDLLIALGVSPVIAPTLATLGPRATRGADVPRVARGQGRGPDGPGADPRGPDAGPGRRDQGVPRRDPEGPEGSVRRYAVEEEDPPPGWVVGLLALTVACMAAIGHVCG
jgi:hypothetical protein